MHQTLSADPSQAAKQVFCVQYGTDTDRCFDPNAVLTCLGEVSTNSFKHLHSRHGRDFGTTSKLLQYAVKQIIATIYMGSLDTKRALEMHTQGKD